MRRHHLRQIRCRVCITPLFLNLDCRDLQSDSVNGCTLFLLIVQSNSLGARWIGPHADYPFYSLLYIEVDENASVPSFPSRLEVALFVDTPTFDLLFRSVPSTITDNDLLLVVSRGSTRSEKMQIADLPSGTMRRISRARSIVSGVELWHPAKTTTRKSREFVHCIVIIICCLSKLFLQSPLCFLKRPIFN